MEWKNYICLLSYILLYNDFEYLILIQELMIIFHESGHYVSGQHCSNYQNELLISIIDSFKIKKYVINELYWKINNQWFLFQMKLRMNISKFDYIFHLNYYHQYFHDKKLLLNLVNIEILVINYRTLSISSHCI